MGCSIDEKYLGLDDIIGMAKEQSKELASDVKEFLCKHYKWDTIIEEFGGRTSDTKYHDYRIEVKNEDECGDEEFVTIYRIGIALPNDEEAKELADILDGKVTDGLNAGCPEYVIRYTREIKVRAKSRGEALAIFTDMEYEERESGSRYIGIVSARKLATKKSKKSPSRQALTRPTR